MNKHKHNHPGKHKESEHEDLIRLRTENKLFKAENAAKKQPERRKINCASQREKASIVQDLRFGGYRLTYLLKTTELSRSTYYFETG